FGRLATGSSSNGVTTRKAVSLFTGGGPGATLAFNASVPPRLKSLRHSRTVSSRTLNASAMRGLVQPESVSRMARALSASPRSREPARAVRLELDSRYTCLGVQVSNSKHLPAVCPVFFLQCGATSPPVAGRPLGGLCHIGLANPPSVEASMRCHSRSPHVLPHQTVRRAPLPADRGE